jgi:biotin carboxyl carrier protein
MITETAQVKTAVDTGSKPDAAASSKSEPIFHPFAGSVEVVDILVQPGDKVVEGQIVAHVEAMKAKHNIKSHVSGTVSRINVNIGDDIDSSVPILTID